MSPVTVPLIDLSPLRHGDARARADLAAQVDRACREIGFMVICGHDVDPGLTDAVEETSRAFFDLPLDEKMQIVRPAPDVTRGYMPFKAEVLVRSRGGNAAGDLNESLMIGPIDVADTPYYTAAAAGRHFAPNLWPARPSDLRPAYERYYRAMETLAADVMRLFAMALGLPETYFDSSIDRHISRLRVRNYPAPQTAPEPGQLRAGAHSDYGSLTILKTEDRPGGLQVLTKDGDWRDVPHLPDCFIVNIGDMMARWTNDRWVSTLHRVVNPPMQDASRSRRQSLVFFHNPNYDAAVSCLPSCTDASNPPRYKPTTSGGHLREKFLSTQQAIAYAD
ncbi:isopenicillin N synthase family dioxygenase [Vineibacter terrae]|uniref:isopenicillin N synthase family dioxygenase n=1 Tax=Vineibacter terrae TaxID=2586908 RepID=UPI002E329622|nr:2-oxoglutarate and iron-dependent oxygenase domain-containing protein [Vineibacter terrae]HEX2891244.1 2-oxoglutarate and iron-dependent oxygenase domain-containing protein [Vineibacter terrae]